MRCASIWRCANTRKFRLQALKSVPESYVYYVIKMKTIWTDDKFCKKLHIIFGTSGQEYQVNLQRKENNLMVGQLTLIIYDNQPPLNSLLGRIIQTHPGSDGLVRVATIYKNDTLKRPINKLSSLIFQSKLLMTKLMKWWKCRSQECTRWPSNYGMPCSKGDQRQIKSCWVWEHRLKEGSQLYSRQ